MLGSSIWHGFFMLLYPLEAKKGTHFTFPMFVYQVAAGSSNWSVFLMTLIDSSVGAATTGPTRGVIMHDPRRSSVCSPSDTAWTRGARTASMFWARIAGGALACQRSTTVESCHCLVFLWSTSQTLTYSKTFCNTWNLGCCFTASPSWRKLTIRNSNLRKKKTRILKTLRFTCLAWSLPQLLPSCFSLTKRNPWVKGLHSEPESQIIMTA